MFRAIRFNTIFLFISVTLRQRITLWWRICYSLFVPYFSRCLMFSTCKWLKLERRNFVAVICIPLRSIFHTHQSTSRINCKHLNCTVNRLDFYFMSSGILNKGRNVPAKLAQYSFLRFASPERSVSLIINKKKLCRMPYILKQAIRNLLPSPSV